MVSGLLAGESSTHNIFFISNFLQRFCLVEALEAQWVVLLSNISALASATEERLSLREKYAVYQS